MRSCSVEHHLGIKVWCSSLVHELGRHSKANHRHAFLHPRVQELVRQTQFCQAAFLASSKCMTPRTDISTTEHIRSSSPATRPASLLVFTQLSFTTHVRGALFINYYLPAIVLLGLSGQRRFLDGWRHPLLHATVMLLTPGKRPPR